jgi:hypothetical protein
MSEKLPACGLCGTEPVITDSGLFAICPNGCDMRPPNQWRKLHRRAVISAERRQYLVWLADDPMNCLAERDALLAVLALVEVEQ